MMKIRNIMTKGVVTIDKNSGIMEAATQMISKSVSSLVVFDKNKPVAIISEHDIVKGFVSKKTKVWDIMGDEFMIVSPLTTFSEITKSLRERKIQRFPVVEDGKLIGLITETDIIQATRDFTRLHQIVQEAILTIFGLATAFFLFYFSPIGASIFASYFIRKI
ncbi:CBS domain-containing protein [Candidatus Woesearchaeota archaeon]|nr:CBS domain-containing protein [Candidatus Woesearchaeota archaeon]